MSERELAGPRGTTTVLALWVGYRSGPWTVRSLERTGYRVLRAHPEGARDGSMPGRPRPLPYPSPLDDPDGFVRTIAAICAAEDVACVLPVDEDIVRLLAERGPELAGAAVAGPTREQYSALCDKAALGATAQRLGVAHPETLEVGEDRRSGDWPPLPSIVKPSISGSHGATSRPTLVWTEAERERAIGGLLAAGIPALVQQRLTGPRWVGHCVRAARSFAFLGFRVHRDHPRGDGPASVMTTARVPQEVVDGTRRLLEGVGYIGPCSLSFIEHEGRFLVHDVNLRLGATVGASVRSGFDIPRMAVAAALGRDLAPPRRTRRVAYVSLDGELRELLSALRRRPEDGDGALEVARRIATGMLHPRHMLDPSPFDPGWVLQRAARAGRVIGSRDPVPTTGSAPAGEPAGPRRRH